jgi:3D-(3,5/4)-trihydroxycyclohexane-1,2-dione acylhydrolase (decyclizing)
MGCNTETAKTVAELEDALARARKAERTTVISIRTDPHAWSEGGAFWEVGVPEVSDRPEVAAARQQMMKGKAGQRFGW